MVLQLPLEVCDVIADLVHSDVLIQVCQKLRKLLGTHRYVKLRCTGENLQRVLGLIGNLRSLQLGFGENSVGESGAQALAALKDAASLHTLSLILRWKFRGRQWGTGACSAEGCRLTAYPVTRSSVEFRWRQWGTGACSAEGCPLTAYPVPRSWGEFRGRHWGTSACSAEGCRLTAFPVPRSWAKFRWR